VNRQQLAPRRHAHSGPAAGRGAGRWLVPAAGLAGAGLALLIVGGYGLHWRWTGLSDSVTLWDWLQVLALPLALAAAPILMRHHRNLPSRHRRAILAAVTAFAILVVAGYLVPMGWTGFTGNTLWDWLSLLMLPSVVATASLWATSWPLTRRQLSVLAGAGIALLAVAIPGYLAPWRWTGFAGNTAWDWVKLLLLPLLLPTAVIPLTTRYFAGLVTSASTQRQGDAVQDVVLAGDDLGGPGEFHDRPQDQRATSDHVDPTRVHDR